MRQVPRKYLIIGRGRLASHLANYFQFLEIPFCIWTRDMSTSDLVQLVEQAPRILLAIKDDAIEGFINQFNLPFYKTIHFSGALSTPLATRLHPLMTFTHELYSLEKYKTIPFVGETGAPTLEQMLPELPNPYFVIPTSGNQLYHALCVLSGNGTTVLWQTIFKAFEEKLHLPKDVLIPYLQQICENLTKNSETALTGPWIREDQKTILKNQTALEGSPFAALYNSLLNTFQSNHPVDGQQIRSLQ